ncbi:MAG: hypothetical protein SVG88_13525 [Halobacteriales archaeon]|nr:hypothetical protein [Halobacteriales archaeon]
MALIALVAAIGLITGTGAFTTVTAERTATVTVSGDKAALLSLAPYPGPNGDGTGSLGDGYARLVSGQLAITIGGHDSSVGGVNTNAKTDLHDVFIITNQGAESVGVSISDSDGSDDDRLVTFYNESVADYTAGGAGDEGGLEGTTNATLTPGESLVVSIYIDTTGHQRSDITDDDGDGIPELITGITVRAEAVTA